MTTVVYNHKEKEIGIDSRTTMGLLIESDNTIKMREKDGVKFFLCGDVSHIESIIECYPNDTTNECDAHGFIIIDKEIKYIYCEGLIIKTVRQENSLAVGSGGMFAISAIDFGKTTREAIKYAATKDAGTGGKIRIYKV